ncbi:MAG: hypothetical protein HOH33_07955, partial [Verrucomicrobia bacterium]|nr:hypothetical protein [Verrucomicrobiota bacterium]
SDLPMVLSVDAGRPGTQSSRHPHRLLAHDWNLNEPPKPHRISKHATRIGDDPIYLHQTLFRRVRNPEVWLE